MSLALPTVERSYSGLVSLRVSDPNLVRNQAFISILAAQKDRGPPPAQRRRRHGMTASSSAPGLKVAPGLQDWPPAKPSGRREVDPVLVETAAEELRVKQRVFRLRQELARSRSLASRQHIASQNKQLAQEVREETARMQGAHLHKSVTFVAPASSEEVSRVATLLVRQLAREPDPSKRSWWKVFKNMDEDGDGHISFAELVKIIRKVIKVTQRQLSDERIQAVWSSIDIDSNGWIDVGEFGRFFRQGEKPKRDVRRQESHVLNVEPEHYREPTGAEIHIKEMRQSRARLEREERFLLSELMRSSISLPALHSSSTVRKLPPLH